MYNYPYFMTTFRLVLLACLSVRIQDNVISRHSTSVPWIPKYCKIVQHEVQKATQGVTHISIFQDTSSLEKESPRSAGSTGSHNSPRLVLTQPKKFTPTPVKSSRVPVQSSWSQSSGSQSPDKPGQDRCVTIKTLSPYYDPRKGRAL